MISLPEQPVGVEKHLRASLRGWSLRPGALSGYRPGMLPAANGRRSCTSTPATTKPRLDYRQNQGFDVAKLNDDQRRALKTLAHQDGCAEAVLLADGFSIDQLAGLVVGGYAVMQRRRVEISGRMRTVVWMQITEKGRMAIAD